MYFPYFMAYMAVGLALTLIALFWALRNGQFKDQQRARYLPLDDDPEPGPVRVPGMRKGEAYALMTLALLGLLASGAVLLFSLLRAR
ncbi:MAG: cbb3-type cytochrome oxidase assembly protein [Syntrophobacteraceae bacterium]